MRIFDRLLASVPQDAVIEDVSIGIFWTFVHTQYGSAISATAHRWIEDPPGAIIPWAGSLAGMPVKEIASLYDSPSLTARSLANAAVAASFNAADMTGTRDYRNGQALIEDMCLGGNPRIAMVGHFHFAQEMRERGYRLDVYELDGRCQEEDIPSSRMPELLPKADIVMMTSSTIITHSTEDILKCCRRDARKVIIGPTVPLHPLLWDFGFDAICASVIHDPDYVAVAAREGGNHRQLKGCEKINFIKDMSHEEG